jgi:hypothetical protein
MAIELLLELGQLELDRRTTLDHLEPDQPTAARKRGKGERHPNRRDGEADPEHIATQRRHDQAASLDLDARSDLGEAKPAQTGTYGEAAGIETEPARQVRPSQPRIERALNDLGPDANDASSKPQGPGGHQAHLSCLDRQASDGETTELDVVERDSEPSDPTCDDLCWGEGDAHAQGTACQGGGGDVAHRTNRSTDVSDWHRPTPRCRRRTPGWCLVEMSRGHGPLGSRGA